jgi:bacillithiol biosynthesis cysteine-adding enzyme BshC
MEPSCVRQTASPGTRELFGDYLYHFQRVNGFYPHSFSDWDELVGAARQLRFPNERRDRIVAALRPGNPGSASLDQLAQPGTVAVVTGQQVGLLSGPAYTVYKALTAVRIARQLQAEGVRAVPVFWLATEDHDLAEVDHAWVFDGFATPSKIALKPGSLNNVPVGTVEIRDLPVNELQKALGDLPFASAILRKVAEYYYSGATYGSAFHAFLKDLLREFDLIYLDPLTPAIREVSAPFLAEVAERIPELTDALLKRTAELEAASYHAQVHLDAASSLLFHLEDGRRTALKYKDKKFSAKDRSFSAADLRQSAERLSPNALLRPVMQDYLLPTVSYVGGPAEIAYLAQSQVLYERLLGRMPVVYPRNSFTLLDERASKLLTRYGLRVEDLLSSEDRVKSVIAAKLVPHDLRHELSTLRSELTGALSGLREKLLQFDPTLAAATEKSITKISYQVDKLAGKTARETMRRDQQAVRDADYLLNLIYPQRHLQERFYSIVPFLAKYGWDLPQQLYEQTQLSCPDHMVRVV